MNTRSLFHKGSGVPGIYAFFIVNRLQMLFFVLVMPMYLIQPYMIWAILAAGLLSQLNLWLLSKWFKSDYAAKGYEGFAELFGTKGVRVFAFLALFPLILKISVIMLGYVDIVHQYIFPAMNRTWLVILIFVVCCALAVQGLQKTMRFSVVVFLCTIWLPVLYVPFYFPPAASVRDLYPLIPTNWPIQSWQGLLFIWSTLSCPEFLIFLPRWFEPRNKILKHLSLANAFSVVEYLILFTATLLFFGRDFLIHAHYPVINMIRYLQYPVFERIDLLLISLHSLPVVFAIAFLVLYIYGALRILAGRLKRDTGPGGFTAVCVLVIACLLVFNDWFWETGRELRAWPVLQMWVGACSYLIVPCLLVIAVKWKGRAGS